jgi:hypothetical protein
MPYFAPATFSGFRALYLLIYLIDVGDFFKWDFKIHFSNMLFQKRCRMEEFHKCDFSEEVTAIYSTRRNG